MIKHLTKTQFSKLIKESVRKEHTDIKNVRLEWVWFKRNCVYPTGLKGSSGNVILHATGYKSKTFLLTASYNDNGTLKEWSIR